MTMVSMDQIQEMLVGSRVLNRMKEEIDTTVSFVLGMVSKKDMSRFRFNDVVCEFTTSTLRWEVTKNKRVFSVNVWDAKIVDRQIFNDWGANQIPMGYIQLVYEDLPQLLTHLVELFPSLNERFSPLLKASRSYYPLP